MKTFAAVFALAASSFIASPAHAGNLEYVRIVPGAIAKTSLLRASSCQAESPESKDTIAQATATLLLKDGRSFVFSASSSGIYCNLNIEYANKKGEQIARALQKFAYGDLERSEKDPAACYSWVLYVSHEGDGKVTQFEYSPIAARCP